MWLERLDGGAAVHRDVARAISAATTTGSRARCARTTRAIEAAVYAVGGWSDGYTNAIPRLLEGLPGPRKGLIGPWAHAWPQAGPPGPAIGFLQETLRWWDHWLGGVDTGIMDEPMLRAYIQELVPAGELLHRAAGVVGGRAGLARARRGGHCACT